MDIVKTKSYRGVCKIQACFGYKSWRSTQCKHRFLTLLQPLQNYWVFPFSVPFLGRWLLRQWEPCRRGCAAQLQVETQRAHFARDWLTRCRAFRHTMGSSSGRSRVLDSSRKCVSRTVWSGDCCPSNQWSYREKKRSIINAELMLRQTVERLYSVHDLSQFCPFLELSAPFL